MKRPIAVATVTLLLVAAGFTQTKPTPETGYVSGAQYLNAFFGFMLRLPQGADFRDLVLPCSGDSHFLFGLQAQRKGLTAMTVRATNVTGSPTDEAKKAAAGSEGLRTKRLEIGGKEFWKGESEDKSPAGKMRRLTYATAMDGYALQFVIVSFDAKLCDELARSIESVSFFDPAQAKALAGENAKPFPPPSAQR